MPMTEVIQIPTEHTVIKIESRLKEYYKYYLLALITIDTNYQAMQY